MQSSLTKRVLQNTYKLGSRVIQTNLKHIALAQSMTQQATSTVGLTPSFHRNFADSVQFDKVTSYESLISRISNATNVNDLLNITHQNIGLFKNEHVVLSLRVLARLFKTVGPNSLQVDSLQKDERYLELTKKVQENLEEFNEYEILDFLFWLRRFKIARLPTNISEDSLNKVYNKVKEFVKSKSFNWRSLVNLFYDLSALNRNTDEVAAEILNELKADSKLLTPFTIVQILQACARKSGHASPRELSVADYVQRNLAPMLQEFDSDQKCLVFKFLSQLEMNINAPKYRVPVVLFNLKTQLKEILDQLSEVGVVNILDAYSTLPKEFPSDLLDEIKEMVIVTIEHNSENIKSFFLVDFLEKVVNLTRNRRIPSDKIIIIYEEIAKRLPTDDYIGRVRSVDKLCQIYQKAGVSYPPLVDAIYQKISDLQGPFFSQSILRFLSRNGKDVTPLLSTYIENGHHEKMGNFQKLQLYAVLKNLSTTKGVDKYQNVETELRTSLLSQPEETFKLINALADLDSRDSSVEDIQMAAVESLKNARDRLQDFNFYRNVFQSVTSKATRTFWLEALTNEIQEADPKRINTIFDAFLNNQDLTNDRILLFARIVEDCKPENVPFRKLVSALKDNKNFVSEFSRFEPRFNKFLNKFYQLLSVHEGQVRLQSIFSLIKRLETYGVRSPAVVQIARRAYEISKASQYPPSAQLDLLYAVQLLDYGVLRVEDAQAIYTKVKDAPNVDRTTKTRLFSYLIQKSDQSILEKEDIVNEINANLELLQKDLSETGARTVLQALALALGFPPQFLESNKDLYIKAAKSFISFGNAQLYINLVDAIPHTYVRRNYEFYLPIIRELITNYNNFNKRLNGNDITKILTKFSSFNTRNPTIYNYILYDVGRVFNSLKSDDLISVVVAFSKVHIKQTDLFDKILVKIGNNPSNFARGFSKLINSLFTVGFNSQQAKVTIPEAFGKLRINNPAVVLNYLCYVPILNLENEAEVVGNTISRLPAQITGVQSRNLVLLYEYLRLAYKDKPELADKIKTYIPDFDKTRQNVLDPSNALLKAKNQIAEFLRVMNVEYETDHVVEGHQVDLYIPQNKTVVKIHLGNDVNFDKFSLTGKGLLFKKIYQSFQGFTPVFINLSEFNSTPENINKVNYLTATGIPNNNTEGVYDFSRIQKTGSDAAREGREEFSSEEGDKEDLEVSEIAEEDFAEVEEEGDKKN